MKKFRFLPGLAGLIGGFIIYLSVSVVAGISQGITGKSSLGIWITIGFIIMVMTPLWYWILRIPYIIGKERNKKWISALSLIAWWAIAVIILLAGFSIR